MERGKTYTFYVLSISSLPKILMWKGKLMDGGRGINLSKHLYSTHQKQTSPVVVPGHIPRFQNYNVGVTFDSAIS